MPSYIVDKNGNTYKDDKTITVIGNSVTEGITDVLVDGVSVVENNVANIDLTGKQDKLTAGDNISIDPDTHVISANVDVNKEYVDNQDKALETKIEAKQDKLTAGTNIEIIDNTISAAVDVDKSYVDEQVSAINDKLDNKVTKVTSAGKTRLYGIGTDGVQFTIVFDKTALGGSIAQRNGSGTLYVADPQFDYEAATKKYVDTPIAEINTTIENIQSVIPTQASSTNQLADKEFVNSSVNAVAATFRGNFETKAALDTWQTENPDVAKKNDYAVVQQDETHNNQQWRYLYQDTGWEPQYKVNDTPFTEAQNKAINSGITDTIVTNTTNHITNKENPHGVTKTQIGLGNVDNTADNDKPVSIAQQTALDGKLDKVTTTTNTNQAYVKNYNGTQALVNIAQGATGNSIVQRQGDGRIKAANGTQDDDLTTKGQMDTALGDKLDKVTSTDSFKRAYTINADGTQSTMTVGKGEQGSIVIRDHDGMIQIPGFATGSYDVVCKDQMDQEIAGVTTIASEYASTAETNAKDYTDTQIGNINTLLTNLNSGTGV